MFAEFPLVFGSNCPMPFLFLLATNKTQIQRKEQQMNFLHAIVLFASILHVCEASATYNYLTGLLQEYGITGEQYTHNGKPLKSYLTSNYEES
jgi:hypothetical protein